MKPNHLFSCSLSRQGPCLTLIRSQTGEQTLKKQGFQLSRTFSQPFFSAYSNRGIIGINNASTGDLATEKKNIHTLSHCSPLTPFLQFDHRAPPTWPSLSNCIFICFFDGDLQSYFTTSSGDMSTSHVKAVNIELYMQRALPLWFLFFEMSKIAPWGAKHLRMRSLGDFSVLLRTGMSKKNCPTKK